MPPSSAKAHANAGDPAALRAALYGVETRALNQAVKRNFARFPEDFVFRLSREEASGLRRSRSQFVILKRGEHLKYGPLAFTEHGAVMVAMVLNSPRAVQMSIFVVRAFLRLREWVVGQAELAARLADLERRVGAHDHELKAIIQTIRSMLEAPPSPRKQIGFREG
jgi:hypothetical protein